MTVNDRQKVWAQASPIQNHNDFGNFDKSKLIDFDTESPEKSKYYRRLNISKHN